MLMGSIGVLLLGHAGRGRRAEGQRPGAALFDRQGDGRAAVPAGARRRTPSASSRSSTPSSTGSAMPPAAWWCCCSPRCSAGRRCGCRWSAWCSSARGWSAAYVARRQYVENLRESIHQHRVDSERASMPVLDRDTTPLISSRLKGTPQRDRLRAQPVRDGARSQGASGGARPAASRASPRSASRRSGCWRAPATPP